MLTGRIDVSHDSRSNPSSSKINSLFSRYPYRYIEIKKGIPTVVSLCILGYGGGCVSGDNGHFVWQIHDSAILCLHTQGISRIFKTINNKPCIQTVVCEIDNHATLLYLPDPTALFVSSSFEQSFTFLLESPTSSLVFVDWFASGRKQFNESWSFSRLRNILDIHVAGDEVYFENLDLMNPRNSNSHNKTSNLLSVNAHDVGRTAAIGIRDGSNSGENIFNDTKSPITEKIGGRDIGLFGTLILMGPQTKKTRELIDSLRYRRDGFEEYAEQVLKKRQFDCNGANESSSKRSRNDCNNSSGTSLVSVTHLSYGSGVHAKLNNQEMSVIRFQASNTEEGYALLNKLLAPLSSVIGYAPYADRLHNHN